MCPWHSWACDQRHFVVYKGRVPTGTKAGEAPEAWWTGSQESLSIPPSRKALAAHWFTPTCGLSSGQGPAFERNTPTFLQRGRLPAAGGNQAGHKHPTAFNQLQGQRDFLRTVESCTWKTAFLKFSVNSRILFKNLFEYLLEFLLTMPASH